jgi:hypothetical protein
MIKNKKTQALKNKKKKQANLCESPKPNLIYKIYNLWNPTHGFNQETQLSTNLILNDETIKKIFLRKTEKKHWR